MGHIIWWRFMGHGRVGFFNWSRRFSLIILKWVSVVSSFISFIHSCCCCSLIGFALDKKEDILKKKYQPVALTQGGHSVKTWRRLCCFCWFCFLEIDTKSKAQRCLRDRPASSLLTWDLPFPHGWGHTLVKPWPLNRCEVWFNGHFEYSASNWC